MKQFNFHFKKIAVLTIYLSFFMEVGAFAADQRCNLRLTSCPESFNGQTVYVPKNVTAFSPGFYVCKPTKIIEDVEVSSKPPSIMFVIDNSFSMSGISGANATDTAGARFKVTSALVDTIYKKFPNAEIGLAIFQEVLYLDTRDNPNFVPLPADYPVYTKAGYTTQGYLPLLKLDSTLAGGIKTIDLIKQLLETKKVTVSGNGTNQSTVLKYAPQYTVSTGTNINVAFDAATLAMLNAKSAKENQFVIFLSDGEPNVTWPRTAADFQNGWYMPTTFTVYFTNQGTAVPASIATMTNNIRKNGYSTTNPLSDYWGMQVSYESLLSALMTKAINPIFSTIKQEPTTLKLNGVTYNDYRVGDSTFYLPGGLPLKDSITNVKMEINYLVRKDSSNTAYDSIVKVEFNVVRTDQYAQSQDILLNCKDTVLYQVSINATDPFAAEKDSDPGIIEITRNNTSGDLAVYYTISGTATKNIDYTSLVDTAYFVQGQSRVLLEIKPIADINEEGNETVVIKLLSRKNGRTIRYGIKEPDSAVVTIYDIIKEDTVKVAVLFNPLSLSSKLTRDSLNGKYYPTLVDKLLSIADNSDYGTFISVQSSKSLKPIASDNSIYGKAVVFDALGNKIKDLEIKEIDEDRGNYAAFWDATNFKHRKVGSGVYLVKMTFTNIDGKTYNSQRYKIGVKD